MDLIELVQELQIFPKRVASTHGGEYHSPCPKCGGKDRFIIWKISNRYFCRQCGAKGDAIQFCRDFMGLNFHAACTKMGVEPKTRREGSYNPCRPQFNPQEASLPSQQWREQANQFVLSCQRSLIESKEGMKLMHERGFSQPCIEEVFLGWNGSNRLWPREQWGLSKVIEEGKERNLWIPSGIVIPTFQHGEVIKLKIRRNQWHTEDYLPKYIEVSGSMKRPSLYGNNFSVILLLEAELDALLVQQAVGDLCSCLALGGASKKPDKGSHELLQQSSLILFSLDFDQAGKQAFKFWKKVYPQLRAWPVPIEKSPGDAFKAGVDLKQWVLEGIAHCKQKDNTVAT